MFASGLYHIVIVEDVTIDLIRRSPPSLEIAINVFIDMSHQGYYLFDRNQGEMSVHSR